jgi:hypothetical protein
MPPRRSARVALAERATTALSPLPLSVVLHIFSLLPVDCRLRCAEVCRGWRGVLTERSLWKRLELTAESGVRVPERYDDTLDALLRCAAARAGGGLHSLHVGTHLVSHAALLDVLTANAGALRELGAHARDNALLGLTPAQAEALLLAAPQLRVLATDLYCEETDMLAGRHALRNEAPFGPLRVRLLDASLADEDEAGIVAFAADVVAHASLKGMTLRHAPLITRAALDAVVDAALARRLQHVELYACALFPAPAPALARLLSSDALTTTMEFWHMNLLDAPAARVLAAALRANSTLTTLTLANAGVFVDAAAAAELLGALTGHASMQTLCLRDTYVVATDQAAVGALLGALVAANAPALTELCVSHCYLGDAGLRPLFEALPQNTHLRTLICDQNGMSEACARDVLLPVVRANASLREVKSGGYGVADADIARELRSRAPL